jgi:hypothetical protein
VGLIRLPFVFVVPLEHLYYIMVGWVCQEVFETFFENFCGLVVLGFSSHTHTTLA